MDWKSGVNHALTRVTGYQLVRSGPGAGRGSGPAPSGSRPPGATTPPAAGTSGQAPATASATKAPAKKAPAKKAAAKKATAKKSAAKKSAAGQANKPARDVAAKELVRPAAHPEVDRLLDRPVFVMSTVRSGSTLLRVLLNAHSMIHAPHELHVRRLRVKLTTGLAKKSMELLGHNEADLEHLLWDRVLHRELMLSGKSIFVDKTPSNSFAYERLSTVWPDARYIFLLRHPASIAASWIEATAHDRSRSEAITDALRYMRALERARNALPGLTIRYEDITADPAAATQRICAFLEIPWESGMLDYGGSQRFVKGVGDWSENIRSGSVQPGRDLPSAEEIPDRLRSMSRRWGYLEDDTEADDEDAAPVRDDTEPTDEELEAGTGSRG